jgi:hypothetical protein
MAQCIVDPTAFGSPCAGGIGSQPIGNGQAVQPRVRITSPARSFEPTPIPAPRQAPGLGAPRASLLMPMRAPGRM